MSEDKPYFDETKREKALKWLQLKAPNLTCECCGQKKWTLADMVMSMPYTGGGGLTIGGATYPQFMVICNTCGNTKFFNAVIAEILKSEPPKGGENGK